MYPKTIKKNRDADWFRGHIFCNTGSAYNADVRFVVSELRLRTCYTAIK